MKIELTLPLLPLLALLSSATAFVSGPTRGLAPSVATTSTTLYYRDDVPPIGSSPHWETPNDFNQFLTQCSIQSFMFLLKSLRDDHTVRWLDEFTQPVLQQHSANATLDGAPPPKKKVTLAEAAQSALLQTEIDLGAGKVMLPKHLGKTVDAMSKKNNPISDTIKFSTPPPMMLSMAQLLKDKIAVKSAFRAFSKAKEAFAGPDASSNKPATSSTSNTGISSLYSGPTTTGQRYNTLPTSDSAVPAVKKNWSPFGNGKPKAVAPTPFSKPFETPSSLYGAAPKEPSTSDEAKKKVKDGAASAPVKKSFASFGQAQKPVAPTSTSSSISSLYGAPPSKQETIKGAKPSEDSLKSDDTPTKRTKKRGTMLRYHGLAILNNTMFPTWDSYFEQLLDRPTEAYLVQSWHEHVPDYEMDIDPASLCRRLISVRGQIAEEFEHDLEVIANMGGLTLKSYHKMLKEIREQRAEDELQQQKDELEKKMPPKSMEDSIGANNGATSTDDVNARPAPQKPKVQRANLLFLDSPVANGASADYAPSPLRKGNFDLLCLLATQEAIHRVLNDPSRQARKSPEHGSNQFLQDFYVTRLLSHFSGDQRYGRSDDFLEELLETPPRMISVGGEDGDELTKDLTYLVDPVAVAKTILDEREKVSLEWKQQLAEQTKQDHMDIQKMVLARVMVGSAEECRIVDADGNDTDETENCFE